MSNWAYEFDKWVGKASQPKRVVIRKGGEEGTQQLIAYGNSMKQHSSSASGQCKPGQVLIVSYDLFRMNVHLFPTIGVSAGLLVVDEGHRLKNKNGSHTLTALEGLPTDARLCLTATPVQNNLSEFHTLANFVSPGILGDLSEFSRTYERPIAAANRKGATPAQKLRGQEQSRQLEAMTKQFVLRRLQRDVLKTMLPPRTEVLLFCRPSSLQCTLYNQSIAGKEQQHRQGNTGFADALTALTVLRKVCGHPDLVDDTNTSLQKNRKLLSGKFAVLDALLQAIREDCPDDKVVLVSNFTSTLSLVENMILKPSDMPYLRLDGTLEVAKRQALVDTFNHTSATRNFCFLLSSKAGGCGLNLIGANRLISLDPDWNPASDTQAMGRVYRQGQTKPCFIYRMFTSNTVEEVIYQRQTQKGGLAALTVDGKKGSGSGHFTKEELSDCFTPLIFNSHTACSTKVKKGSEWPEYTGPDCLRCRGCDDAPLLLTASSMMDTLGHVHIVQEEKKVDRSCKQEPSTRLVSSMYMSETSEEEFGGFHDDDYE